MRRWRDVPEAWADPVLGRAMLAGLVGRDEVFFLRDEDGLAHVVAVVPVGGVADVLTVWTDPAVRRQGRARALVAAVLAAARAAGCTGCALEVRAGNAAARGLYAALGFGEVHVRRGYYADPVEDGVVMAIPLE